MKVKIAMNGLGGELDSVTIDVQGDEDAEITEAVSEFVSGMSWHVGDWFQSQTADRANF